MHIPRLHLRPTEPELSCLRSKVTYLHSGTRGRQLRQLEPRCTSFSGANLLSRPGEPWPSDSICARGAPGLYIHHRTRIRKQTCLWKVHILSHKLSTQPPENTSGQSASNSNMHQNHLESTGPDCTEIRCLEQWLPFLHIFLQGL